MLNMGFSMVFILVVHFILQGSNREEISKSKIFQNKLKAHLSIQ